MSFRLDSILARTAHGARATSPQDASITLRHAEAIVYPVFQAIVDHDGHVVCHEVLTRCKTEDAFINPMALYADADRHGYAETLFEKILKAAMKKVGDEPLWINVSTDLIMKPGFRRIVEDAAERHGYTLGKLNVEITEEPCLAGNEALGRRIHDLKVGLGVRITQDDFAPDEHSLDRLRHLPVDFIKTDRQMLIDSGGSQEGFERLKRFIDHCHERGLPVTVEGIETDADKRLCLAAGTDYMQGYLFHRPSVESAACTRPLPPVQRGEYTPHFKWNPIRRVEGGEINTRAMPDETGVSLGRIFGGRPSALDTAPLPTPPLDARRHFPA